MHREKLLGQSILRSWILRVLFVQILASQFEFVHEILLTLRCRLS